MRSLDADTVEYFECAFCPADGAGTVTDGVVFFQDDGLNPMTGKVYGSGQTDGPAARDNHREDG